MKRTAAREIAVQLGFCANASEKPVDELLNDFFDKEYYETLAEESELVAEYPEKKQQEYIKRLVSTMDYYRIQIEKYIEITDYRLMSTYFHMEGVKIKSFKGKLTFKIHGPKQFVNLINMLLRFGEYSGVGIKASIGMGAINVETKERRNRLG